jgi:hypothetical protein
LDQLIGQIQILIELAKQEKYRMEFKNRQGDTCQVQFHFEGWTGGVTYLTPSAKPFTLSEYNTTEDYFKPYRPQQAIINIIASDSSVTIDNFITDSDNDILVIFSFGSFSPYWYGYILQDNFQETWIQTSHILTLTATEGIGQLSEKQFSNEGAEVVGLITPWEAIGYCLEETVQTLTQSRIYNSLYHTSMNDGNTDMCLDQCYVDARIFQQEPKQYDSKLDSLNKINTSFGQTMFQYKGQWYFLRLEDLYIPTNTNLRGFRNSPTGRNSSNRRYDANIGVDESMKPISSEMLRYIMRRTKEDKVTKKYVTFPECVQNSSFIRGTLVSQNSTSKLTTLANWTFQEGSFDNPTPVARTYGVVEEYVDTILSERFAFFRLATSNSSWIISEYCNVRVQDTLNISFSYKYNYYPADKKSIKIAYVLLETDIGNYTLDNEGHWHIANSGFSGTPTAIEFEINDNKDILADEWNEFNITSDTIPVQGKFRFVFYGEDKKAYVDNQVNVKNFSLEVIPVFNIDQRRSNITAHEVKYVKTDNLRNVSDYPTYLEDNVSYNYKGVLFESDGETLTNAEWYRYRYADERFPFLQQCLIPYWEHNRFNRNKIDINAYGLKFNGGADPIGLINTFIFVDDDPDKVYYVLNMREIDFDAATWTATLVEVYDSQKDPGTNITKNFEADVITGSYSSTNYVPWVIISPADFSLGGTTNITYNGSNNITVNIACNVSGAITSSSGAASVDFKLYLNGVSINTQTVYINNNPEYFNVDLSTSGVLLETDDILSVWIDTNIYALDLTGGSMTFSYTTNTAQTFDTYEDKYLTN